MDPSRSKALAFFNTQGTDAVLVASRNPDWAPVVESVWSAGSLAAILAIQVGGTRAALTIDPAGADNIVVFTAWRRGDSGENITVAYIVSGLNTELSVVTTVVDHSITDVDIVVNLATDGAGAATSTAQQVIDAVNDSPSASKYIYAAASGAATGVVAAAVAAALASATPDEDADMTFTAAFTFTGTLPPGGLVGNSGDDVRVAVSAGTDDIFFCGYWIQGADLDVGPKGYGKFEPSGRPVGVSGV